MVRWLGVHCAGNNEKEIRTLPRQMFEQEEHRDCATDAAFGIFGAPESAHGNVGIYFISPLTLQSRRPRPPSFSPSPLSSCPTKITTVNNNSNITPLKGHRLVKATTLSSLSRHTSRAIVVSLAISRSRSLNRFMFSSLRPRRTITFARRAWQVSACVVVQKKYARVFSERVFTLAE